jgi:hypothetical protein
MADSEYINALVTFGRANPINAQILQNDLAAIYAKIQNQDGRTIVSVSQPGQTVAWGSTMTLEDQFIALTQAVAMLTMNPTIFRRTTSRYF